VTDRGAPVLNLLLVAPACDRDDIGEAWVAYQWVSRLADRHKVTVLTYHKRGHTPVGEQLPGVRVIEWTEPPAIGRAERLNSLLKPGYLPFYHQARRWIKNALRTESFDLGHQPVPVAMRYPSPMTGLGIPYVIGPVGGSLESPPGFTADDTAPWYVALRAFDRVRLRRDPVLRRTYEEADCVVGIADYVRELLAPLSVRHFTTLSETAIDDVMEPVDRSRRGGAVRLLYVGRLVRTKGARDAIRAMSELRDLPVVLDVVGDGFDRSACEELARTLRLEDRVQIHGARSRADVSEFYRAADVFVFPSYREPGGNVAFEAMAAGLPLVVADRGGPAGAVDDSCGFRLHPRDPAQYATAIASAVRSLVEDKALRLRLGEGARRRVAEIGLWDKKIDQIDAVYREVLGRVKSR
jgi:glycosyltransferase involved in cell wall biosynthesis